MFFPKLMNRNKEKLEVPGGEHDCRELGRGEGGPDLDSGPRALWLPRCCRDLGGGLKQSVSPRTEDTPGAAFVSSPADGTSLLLPGPNLGALALHRTWEHTEHPIKETEPRTQPLGCYSDAETILPLLPSLAIMIPRPHAS